MNKNILVDGFCPTQDKVSVISVDYLDTGDRKTYIKGLFSCDFTYRNECPLSNNCPIYNDAPDKTIL